MNQTKAPGLGLSFLPILFLVIFLSFNVTIFGDSAISGPNQIALLFAAAFAAILAMWKLKLSWDTLEKSVVKSISAAMSAMLILMLIGSLSGTWMVSGIVPAMIYYGLQVLNPTFFLFAACIVASIVSLATGSSWTTVATVGIALVGIGKALGISEAMIGGAIISGAYFGDKMSPLSDTTNLAPAVAGTDLFTHVRYMTLTTVPTLTISLIIFLILGFTQNISINTANTPEILQAIDDKFYIGPVLFIVPALVIIMILKKIPALPALFVGMVLGAVVAIIFQRPLLFSLVEASLTQGKALYFSLIKAMFGAVSIQTSNEMVTGLLTSKGMSGMLNTIWLILTAMIFGGVMEGAGMLSRIAEAIISTVKTVGGLVGSTVATCVFFNVTASDQYLAIAVPGRMFSDIYRKKNLAPENLSRTLEDAGTVTSALVPWNTCGAYHTGVMGISTLTYAPYAFFNYLSPLMTIFFASMNIKIRKIAENEPLSHP